MCTCTHTRVGAHTHTHKHKSHPGIICRVFGDDVMKQQVFFLLIYKILVRLYGPFKSTLFIFCKLPSRCQIAECFLCYWWGQRWVPCWEQQDWPQAWEMRWPSSVCLHLCSLIFLSRAFFCNQCALGLIWAHLIHFSTYCCALP